MHASETSLNKSYRILISGAAGLMDSALVEHLRAEGRENIAALTHADCDLIDTAATFSAFEQRRPDHAFHAAARVYGILGSLRNQGPLFHENVMMNTNVVEASHRAGVRKVSVMGAGGIYPFPSPGLRLKEDMIFLGRPHAAHAGYANAKLAMLEAYSDSYGLAWAYIVSANLFGPRDRFDAETGNVVPSLIRKFHDAKKNGGKVVIWGDGSAQRDFVYIKDAARIALNGLDGPANMVSGRSIVAAMSSTRWRRSPAWATESNRILQNRTAKRIAPTNARKSGASGSPVYSIHNELKETWDWYCARHD